MVLLIYFMIILIYLLIKKHKSIMLVFVLIQVVSLTGAMFIDGDYAINSVFKGFNLIVTAFVLTIIMLPWMKIDHIINITAPNETKIKRLTYTILAVSVLPFLTFIVVATYVLLYVQDINTFKYAEGVSTDFYYSLPINIKVFIVSNHIYYLSYFLIPLHFYYLGKRDFKISVACFVFSLNIVLYGLTYFSRAVFVHYVSIYLAFLYILFGTLGDQTQRQVKRIVVTVGILFVTYFVYITNARFADDQLYAEIISANSIIQDPVLYSYFDYLSQWYRNGLFVLNAYDFNTFSGQISLQSVLSLLSHFGVLDYNTADFMGLRQSLWPLHWYMFNGYVAYSVYDYGYFLTVIFSLIYCVTIYRMKPLRKSISLVNLLILVLLIQLPLMAIFYSTVGGLLIPFLFLIPIYGYLRVR